ncbi:hypothetical protein EAG_12770 [Camponotus floridanus]|uniref:Uncharacterized protein n=1 Tax=Camponotus floridanus TaxID=104421 RepID=E2AZH2_CAMFO|nr:hypothetical protein EAG_12770 [Camponotus floridanus]
MIITKTGRLQALNFIRFGFRQRDSAFKLSNTLLGFVSQFTGESRELCDL